MVKKLKDLPVGAKVYSPESKFLGESVVFRVAHKMKDRVKLITDGVVALRAFDAMEPKNSNANRRDYGNNRWLHSNIRRYLNTQGVYRFSPQHEFDAPPIKENLWEEHNPYDGTPGFLADFEKEFVDAILPAKNLTAIPSADGGGAEVVTDKMYLPSITEVGLENDTGVNEGEEWDLFTDDDSRIAYPTDSAVADDESGYAKKGEARWYFTRTHSPGSADGVRGVGSSGSRGYDGARYGAAGLRPALDLPPDISVSDKPDSTGAYVLKFNAPPVITSPQPESIGDKNEPFSVQYTVTDGDNDNVKVTEKLNDTTLRTIDKIALGEEQTITLTWEQWQSLPNDTTSTITITADDGQEGTTKRFTFTKRNNRPMLTLNVKDNETYYEGSTLNIKGTATDKDVGDAVIVKYKIADSRERVIATVVSDGKTFNYGKVLTFTKSRFMDGDTAVTNTLVEGQTYTLEVFAQDDKGTKSIVQTRKFKVVPNRSPLVEVTKLPNLEAVGQTGESAIEGKVNDPDGDEVRMTYRLNGGSEQPLALSDNTFVVPVKVTDLKVGRNTYTLIARDVYDAMTTKTVEVTLESVASGVEHIKSKAYYDIDTKGVETDGILVWVRRPIDDDTDYKASLSITDVGAQEKYVTMDKSTSVVQGHNRDEFIGSVDVKASDVKLKLEFDGNEAPIQMLQGVIK